MSERIIPQAKLQFIENSLDSVGQEVRQVSQQVSEVSSLVEQTGDNLEQLTQEFREYVRQDYLSKQLQLAETRLVKIRQELDMKFGHYDDVRRRALGLLQAVDVNLVRKETIETASEAQLLAAPGYWLAPCLIALSAWINDNQNLATRALSEAIRRDDEKTSLFFALVARRTSRYAVSREWLDRYLGQQDPYTLQREIVILIDGFTNGVFGPEARHTCSKQIALWIQDLSQKAGYVEEQQQQWVQEFLEMAQPIEDPKYNYLKDFTANWSELAQSLMAAGLHETIVQYFTDIFAKEVIPSKNIAFAVDQLLEKLISQFDDEELPLRQQERLQTVIIEENGDKEHAQQRVDNEYTYEQGQSFAQMLTNFALHPQDAGASIATQKLSLALSKEWIKSAHQDLTAASRMKVPAQITVEINDWSGITTDGSNEEELINSLEEFIKEKENESLRRVKLGWGSWFCLPLGVGVGAAGFLLPGLFLLSLIFIGIFVFKYRQLAPRRNQIINEFVARRKNYTDILRATLADVADYRHEFALKDAHATDVEAFLEGLSPDNYTSHQYDKARSVLHA